MIHHGIFGPFRIGFSGSLDTAFTLLPQYFKELGLSTHMIGKVSEAIISLIPIMCVLSPSSLKYCGKI